MDIDEDNKDDVRLSNNTSKSPIITDIEWTDNGNITFSFAFYPQYKHSIIKYELCYCYVNANDDKWYGYALNNWKTITVPTTDSINNNIELRISTNTDIYHDDKNENIELIMKLRCETKSSEWVHTFYSEFSPIYFIQSITIPHILNKKTQIYKVLNMIFDINNDNQNAKSNGIQQLVSLYEKHQTHSVINKVFTKLLQQYIQKYYQNKYIQLLSLNISLSIYLIEIDKCINYESENLFPHITKYCTHSDIEKMISIIVNNAFDFSNNASTIKTLLENKDSGINYLFSELICNDQTAIQVLDRILQYNKYFNETKQRIMERYFYQAIQHLYTFKTNVKIFEIHDRI
eukprot:364904_1